MEAKLVDNKKKWTLALLKQACDIFGISASGTREAVCTRLAEYLQAPHATATGPAPKLAAKVTCKEIYIMMYIYIF